MLQAAIPSSWLAPGQRVVAREPVMSTARFFHTSAASYEAGKSLGEKLALTAAGPVKGPWTHDIASRPTLHLSPLWARPRHRHPRGAEDPEGNRLVAWQARERGREHDREDG